MARYSVNEPSPTGFCSVLDSDGNYLGGGYTKESAKAIAAALNKAELFDEILDLAKFLEEFGTRMETMPVTNGEVWNGFPEAINAARAILAKVNEQ